jgi:chromosome segregation ATPase
MNIARVTRALNQAIENCTSEREGLSQRLADVTSRAAIVAGNDTDEYLERERAVSDQLSVLDSEVKNAQRRLEELAYNIAQFERLREDLRSRFSQHAISETGRHDMVGVGTPVDAR